MILKCSDDICPITKDNMCCLSCGRYTDYSDCPEWCGENRYGGCVHAEEVEE